MNFFLLLPIHSDFEIFSHLISYLYPYKMIMFLDLFTSVLSKYQALLAESLVIARVTLSSIYHLKHSNLNLRILTPERRMH